MFTEDYFDRLLLRYSGTFDINKPYTVNGKEYAAYGYFYSHTEKYVLVREANMWSADSFEHILFTRMEECGVEDIYDLEHVISGYMEPVFVRKGKRLPEENHMYSYLTICIICQKVLSKEVTRAVRKFKYDKGYRCGLSGFSQAHILCATMDDEKVITNFAGRKSKSLYMEIFEDAKKGK